MRNYVKLAVLTLFLILLPGCGNSDSDLGQGITTEEINIEIPGLEKEYKFLWLSDLHFITENDEIAAEDLETVAGTRESFKNAAGMYSDEFWM